MKFGKYIFGLPVALLFCVALFIAENDRYTKINLTNPFVENQTKNNESLITSTDKPVFHLTAQREVFVLDKNTVFDQSSKTLIDGRIYLNNNFLSNNDLKQSIEVPKTLENTTKNQTNIGQIQSGKAVISAFYNSLIVQRDKDNEQTLVYTLNFPAYIWLPGSDSPFFMPAHHRATLKDKILSSNSGNIFYTKQKKEVLLTSMKNKKETIKEIESFYEDSKKITNDFNLEIINYAQKLPKKWFTLNPESIGGMCQTFLKHMQRYYSLGYKPEWKVDYQYKKTLTPIAELYYSLNDTNLFDSKIELTQEHLMSTNFIKFFIENPSYQKDWDDFSVSTRVWMQSEATNQQEEKLTFISDSRQNTERVNFHQIQKSLVALNVALLEKDKVEATKELEIFQSLLRNFEITNVDQNAWSNLRRLYLDLLVQYQDILLKSESVKALHDLIKTEVKNVESNKEAFNEITLENAQSILKFFKEINNPEVPEENEDLKLILRDIFITLEVQTALDKIDRSLFTQEELETIQEVNLYEEYLISRDEEEGLEERNRILNDLFRPEDNEEILVEPVVIEDDIIDTQEEFEELLTSRGIKIGSANFVVSENEIQVSQAIFQSKVLNAEFTINTQIFKLIDLDNKKEKEISPQELIGVLFRLDRAIQSNEVQEEDDYDPSLDFVRQATIAKIADQLSRHEVRVSQSSIEPTDKSLREFIITEGLIDNKYQINFKYNSSQKDLTNLVIKSGNNRFEFGKEVYEIESIQQTVNELYEAQFE